MEGWVRFMFNILMQARLTVHNVMQAFFALLGSTYAIAITIIAAPTCKCLEQAC
jgi:hypothetical protein